MRVVPRCAPFSGDGTFYLWPLCSFLLPGSFFFPFSFLTARWVCVCHFDGLLWCNGAVASRPLFSDVPMCITMCILYWYRLHFFVLSRIGAPFGFPSLFILLKKVVFCCPILSQCPLWFSVQIFFFFSFHSPLTTCQWRLKLEGCLTCLLLVPAILPVYWESSESSIQRGREDTHTQFIRELKW